MAMAGAGGTAANTKEGDVGIVAYCSGPEHGAGGLVGVMRHLYSDFAVREVDADGVVRTLRDPSQCRFQTRQEEITVTKAEGDAGRPGRSEEGRGPSPAKEESSKAGGGSGRGPEYTRRAEAALAALVGVLSPSDVAALKDLLNPADADSHSKAKEGTISRVILQPMAAKESRTAVHAALRGLTGVLTETREGGVIAVSAGNDERSMYASRKRSRNGEEKSQHLQQRDGGAKRGRAEMDPGGGGFGGMMAGSREGYLWFDLVKENVDTHAALWQLGRAVNLPASAFQVAGTKDKRAVTTQRVSVSRSRHAGVSVERMARSNGRVRGVRVGNWAIKDSPVNLGDLVGNHFTIVLRDLSLSTGSAGKDVEGAMVKAREELRNTGFINYYGLQRFGTGVNPTHKVGAQLLQGNYEAAVKMILQPMVKDEGVVSYKSNHSGAVRAALEAFRDTGDARAALALMPRQAGSSERSILESLARKPGDWKAAVGSIPRTTRSLYLHAWQGYVWNRAVSARVVEGGVESARVGDLVFVEGARPPGTKWDATETRQPSKQKLRGVGAVRKIESDEEAFQYKITDVVVPLPGFDVTYPGGAAGEAIKRAAAEEGVDLEAHVSQRRSGADADLNLSGDYRHFVLKPTDFEAEVVKYTDPNADIEPSDYWLCQGKKARRVFGADNDDNDEGDDVRDGGRGREKQERLGVKLKFTLPPGAYATMLVRELTKMPTDVDAHRTASLEQQGRANADAGPDGSTTLQVDD